MKFLKPFIALVLFASIAPVSGQDRDIFTLAEDRLEVEKRCTPGALWNTSTRLHADTRIKIH